MTFEDVALYTVLSLCGGVVTGLTWGGILYGIRALLGVNP